MGARYLKLNKVKNITYLYNMRLPGNKTGFTERRNYSSSILRVRLHVGTGTSLVSSVPSSK
jgi:hypothetical protein